MDIPSYEECFLQLLKFAADSKPHNLKEAVEAIAEHFQLPPEKRLQRHESGVNILYNRVAWARTYLKQAELLHYPERGMLQITDEGRKVLESGIEVIDIKYLERFPAFLEFKNRKGKRVAPSDQLEAPPDLLEDLEGPHMLDKQDDPGSGGLSYWFVGASYSGTNDQTPRFLSEGIWENGYADKYLDLVKSMRPGDRIAIKASFTRKHDLPFDSNGRPVSVMKIKAIGTITENLGDGNLVRVDWKKENPVGEWYFYTYRSTIWRVQPGNWMADALIAYTFDGKSQDVEQFRNDPYWRDRYGNRRDGNRFGWTDFYEAVAEKLLIFQNNRTPLVEGIHDIASRVTGLSIVQDKFPDGKDGPLKDICPFTAMGIFNRHTSDSNRKIIAAELAKLLHVTLPVPESFDGVPVLNNKKSWFFSYAKTRGTGDIDALWRVFAAAKLFLDEGESARTQKEFVEAYDAACQVSGVKWNLSTGLYWAHPWDFPTLDSRSRGYISNVLKLPIQGSTQNGHCNAVDYLKILDDLHSHFDQDERFPVDSFPELSLAAWEYKGPVPEEVDSKPDHKDVDFVREAEMPAYGLDDIIKDGCFQRPEKKLRHLLELLKDKKNLILQGPPGTGKTWLAKRLAFALMGYKDENSVRAVQFHPNLSYEDFVRGWRPSGDGKLTIADGVFMEAISTADKQKPAPFVVVIEEINRGNPAQIFGELLTLLESSKRNPGDALELCYPDANGTRAPVHIPDNLYVIGTMNIADRSLALVDLALRRRFAFATLEPQLGDAWKSWVTNECGIDPALVDDIERRINELNKKIVSDARLGKQFRIGHSYVTPHYRITDTRIWFRRVVENEIKPLLEEYWFDESKQVDEAEKLLLNGWDADDSTEN